MVIGTAKLSFEVVDLLLGLVYLQHLRIDVFSREVGNEAGTSRVIQSADVLLDELVAGRETRHHERVRVAAEGLLEELRQFAFSVRNEFGIVSFLFGETSNNFPKNHQTLVDVDTLFGLLTSCSGETLLFRTSQIH